MPVTLLEPVAAGQVRFRMQGLSADARGIAVGRDALLAFDSIDGVVAFIGAYSEEASLDALFAGLAIERVRRTGGGSAFLLRAGGQDGYGLDRLSRLAGAVRGRLYTGNGTIFVRFRDRAAPFGYDLAQSAGELGLIGKSDIVAVEPEQATYYRTEQSIDPVELLQRLSVRSVPLPPQGVAAAAEECGLREMVLVLVAPGLADRVLSYLWRLNAPMAGTRISIDEARQPALLLRLRHPSPRVLGVLFGIPGVELLAPVSSRAAVEVGWRHPVNLAAASGCLPGDEMYLFRGRADRVERLDGAPRFVEARFLVRSKTAECMHTIGETQVRSIEPLQVELKLRATSDRREPRAVLVAWQQVELLRRTLYLMPPSALAASRVAALREGVLVLVAAASQRGLAVGDRIIPIGRRLCEVAPGVLVCDGYELYPRVSPELMRGILGLEGEDKALFLAPGRTPFRLRSAQVVPLEAAALGRVQLEDVAESPDLVAPAPSPRLENEQLGRFSLWGFRPGAS
ncbi:MAG: hypothetical protein V3V08_16285 [Nannocystaceae bacterium]